MKISSLLLSALFLVAAQTAIAGEQDHASTRTVLTKTSHDKLCSTPAGKNKKECAHNSGPSNR